MPAKEKLNLVFIGHVDHGKSTLMGRLLTDGGAVDRRVIDKYRDEAAKSGKATFEYAWVTDTEKEERERGLTINVRHVTFETEHKTVYLIDAPGHQDFIRNMISGTSEADAAVLVVACDEGIKPQTREHAVLARTMGIEQVVVAVNKMDKVGYTRDKFEPLASEVVGMLQRFGFPGSAVTSIPLSGFVGDNVANRSASINWYHGPTLMEAIDGLQSTSKPLGKAFRMPVDAVYKIEGVGRVFAGVIASGRIRTGESVTSSPSGIVAEVRSIEKFHKPTGEATAGDDIGLTLRGEGVPSIRPNEVLSATDMPIRAAREIQARVVILQHPTMIHVGYSPQLHVGTQTVRGTLRSIAQKVDPRTGSATQPSPEGLQSGDVADVSLFLSRPVAIEEAESFPKLSRFAIRDSGVTIGAGRCTRILA